MQLPLKKSARGTRYFYYSNLIKIFIITFFLINSLVFRQLKSKRIKIKKLIVGSDCQE